jgi:hypothetical protein
MKFFQTMQDQSNQVLIDLNQYVIWHASIYINCINITTSIEDKLQL